MGVKLFLKAILLVVAMLFLSYSSNAQSLISSGHESQIDEKVISTGNGKNILYFIHGVGCSAPSKYASGHPYPHYFVARLAQSGEWDVISGDLRIRDCGGQPGRRTDELTTRAAKFLARRVGELRSRGYQRVVLGGQSSGAWTVLKVAQQSALRADALLFIAPAVFGTATDRYFQDNKVKYLELLAGVRVPTAAVFFSKDAYDPGGRGEATERMLTNASVPHLVINQPMGFSGHGGAWLPVFDYEYGDCINQFLLNPHTMQCKPPPLSSSDFRSIVSIKQVAADRKRLTDDGFSAIIGKRFVVYLGNGGEEEDTFLSSRSRRVESGSGVETLAMSFSNGRFCYPDGANTVCRSIIKWSDRQLLVFDEKTGETTTWWTLKEGQ